MIQTKSAEINAGILRYVNLSDGNEPIKATDSEQPSKQMPSLGNPSLDNSTIEEGSSLNVNQKATGPE